MSTQIISLIASFLAIYLPKWGVTIGSEELTATISNIVIVISGLWIYYQRTFKLKRVSGVENSDVTVLGVRK